MPSTANTGSSRRRRALSSVALLGLLGAAQAPRGEGVIAGQAVDALTGKPLGAVVVSIAGTGMTINPIPNQPRVLTGADGRFVFRDLAPGTYAIAAAKGGYADGAAGRRRANGDAPPVEITAETKSVEVAVRMWKHGAITGTVIDDAGEPVIGIAVRLLARTKPATPPRSSGAEMFVAIARPLAVVGTPVLTDDRGVYRFGGLAAGDYIVVASPPAISATATILKDVVRDGKFDHASDLVALFGLTPTSYNGQMGATAAPLQVGGTMLSSGRGGYVVPAPAAGRVRIYPPTQSAPISLATGEERAGIDVQVVPAPGARIAGTAIGPEGPVPLVSLRLLPAGWEGAPIDTIAPASMTDGAGDFVFAAVPPGRYTLRGGLPRTQGWIDMPLTVGGDDIAGLVVTGKPLLHLTANLQFDGATPPEGSSGRGPLAMPALLLDPVDTATVPDQLQIQIVDGNRQYELFGYPPGRYRVRVPNVPTGWMLRGAMVNGLDVTDTPFDFTKDVSLTLAFTDRLTEMTGAVQSGGDGTTIVAFPTDASKWPADGLTPRRLQSTRANALAQFTLRGLPPGDYYVVAIPEEQADDWRDPATLEALARMATQVTLLEGDRKNVTLQIHQVPR
jgi:uncharacterized protein (DUF2141 family)